MVCKYKVVMIGHRFIGDMLMAQPAIEWLSECSDFETYLIVKSDSALWISAKFFPKKFIFVCKDNKALKKKLIEINANIAVHFDRSLGSVIASAFSGVRCRVGTKSELREFLLHTYTPILPNQHHVQSNLKVVESLWNYLQKKHTHINIPKLKNSFPRIEGFAHSCEKLAVIHMGTTRAAKNPPKPIYVSVIKQILDEGFNITLIGDDKDGAKELILDFPSLVNMVGQTSLEDWFELIAKASVVVSPDTASMHIAAALGIRTIALFGSTNPLLTAGLGSQVKVVSHSVPCSPCYRDICKFKKSDQRHMQCFKV